MIKPRNIIFIIAMLMVILGNGCNKNPSLNNITSGKDNSDINADIRDENVIESLSSYQVRTDMIEAVFVDSGQFANTATVVVKEIQDYPIAGTVNHHTLAMDLQSRFFKSLKMVRPDIKTFIVISPDHFLAGADVSTHAFLYVTQAGTVTSSALPMEGIYEALNVDVFAKEHGVGALAPFIAREFPEAQIVPLFIRPEAGNNVLKDAALAIKELMTENVFIIISSDMSHYLTDKQARINDRITLDWINNNDWQNLGLANDDYTDSKHGFTVLGQLFAEMNIEPGFFLLDYAVSTDYGADKNETTSYINGYYTISHN